jgi:exodeoxyribonuclease V alpha subunit
MNTPTGWDALSRAALERDVLDGVDLSLIRELARRADRTGDAAFHAVMACLLAAVRTGGLRIPCPASALSERLESLLRALHLSPDAASREVAEFGFTEAARRYDPAVQARAWAEAFTAAREEGAYAKVLCPAEEGAYYPLLLSGKCLYFQKHFAAEAIAGKRLAELLAQPDTLDPAGTHRTILDTVLSKHPLRLPAPSGSTGSGPAMVFDPNQVRAIQASLKKRLLVISGGLGTGKTSIAANMLRAAVRAGTPVGRIRLAAPTGRAAQRLSETLRRSLEGLPAAGPGEEDPDRALAALECETLHRLLRYNPSTGEYLHDRRRPLPVDLLLIDEVSMVDIFTLARVLEALRPEASLILMGDMDQLPSVEAGAVLGDLVPIDAAGARSDSLLGDALVLLDRSHRSDAGILEVSRRINLQDGAGALAAMNNPAGAPVPSTVRTPHPALPAMGENDPFAGFPWPAVFLESGRRVSVDGGCKLISSPGEMANPARAWDSLLSSWIGFHYLRHSFDAAAHSGRILATPRRRAYADLVRFLCANTPVEEPNRSGMAWKTSPTPQGQPGGLAEWLDGLGEAFAYLDQARILTFTRKSWHGCESINRKIRRKLQPLWDPWAEPTDVGGFTGSPVMILENDYAKGIYNGDVGIQLRIHGRPVVVFQRPGSYIAFPSRFLPRHEIAFAMTVHKSQGSEYDQALVVLPEPGNRLLFKETLYTAITRARYFAGIYGPREVFLEAVAHRVMRESGLAEHVQTMARPG